MPKGSRKQKAQTGHQLASNIPHADFTVYDYANADPASAKSGRMSKASTSWSNEAKQITRKLTDHVSRDNLAWYERELSDLDLSENEDQGVDSVEENEEQTTTLVPRATRSRQKRRSVISQQDSSGTVYPLDVWFLIGECVSPEDVVLFGQISRGSHFVTHSVRFWYSMYRRFYKANANLLQTLKPQYIERIHGLKARVIRALFLMYSPFQQRLHNRVSFENDPDCLQGACCSLMWYQKVKTHWNFYFKFILPRNTKDECLIVASQRGRKKKFLSLLDDADLHHNPEAGFCVLQIITPNFIPLPSTVMGQVLAKTSLSVGHAMLYHKLKLMFTPQQYTTTGRTTNTLLACGTAIVMDPVLNIHVLNWWDPKYPNQPV